MHRWALFFLIWASFSLAQAEPEPPTTALDILWRKSLEAFSNSTKFSEALNKYREKAESTDLRLVQTTIWLDHLQTTALMYKSTDDFIRQVQSLVKENPTSYIALEHLKWVQSILNEMAEIAPRSPSVALALADARRILSLTSDLPAQDQLMSLLQTRIDRHALERIHLENQLGVSVNDSRFAELAYAEFIAGRLTDSIKRMLLGEYLNVRQFFTPTIRQTREAVTRLAPTGDRGMQLRRATRYANPQNFVRNGWSAEYDSLRIATGDMLERVYETSGDEINRQSEVSKIERNIILCVDSTKSMRGERGQLREMIVPSMVDSIFTQAQKRGEKIVVYIVYYTDAVHQTVKLNSFEDAAAKFTKLTKNDFAYVATAMHDRAIIHGIEGILADKSRLSHLNIVVLTDGDESVDVSQVNAYTEQLTSSREGLRLGISGISLGAKPESLKQDLIRINKSDLRFSTDDPIVQTFSDDTIAKWVSSDWLYEMLGHKDSAASTWSSDAESLAPLANSLAEINLDDEPPPPSREPETQPGEETNLDSASATNEDEADHDNNEYENNDDGASSSDQNNDSRKAQPPIEDMNADVQSKNWEQPENQPGSEIYRLHTSDPLPRFLALARNENMPQAYANGWASAVATREMVPVFVAKQPLHSLIVEALVDTKIVNGVAAIAVPEGYTLAGLQITGQNSTAIENYEVFEITRNGLYVVHFKDKAQQRGRFRYQAFYKRDTRAKRRSPHYNKLDRSALSKVSRLLYSDQLNEMAYTFYGFAKRRFRKTSFEQIAKAMSAQTVYSFSKESSAPPKTSGSFAKYQKFLVNGRLHYQCNGANPLQTEILEAYIAETKAPLIVEDVTGYVVQGPLVSPGTGHVVTYVSDKRMANSYLKLDATPSQMDNAALKQTPPDHFVGRLLGGLRKWRVRKFQNCMDALLGSTSQ